MLRGYPPVPPEADFVSRMEAMRDRYSRPRDARYPVICMDEHAQFLRADKWPSPPVHPGRPATYVRIRAVRPLHDLDVRGTAGPVAHGPRHRAAHGVDWEHPVKAIADHPRYRATERLIRVCDNLNTHTYRSFCPGLSRAPRLSAWSGASSWCLRPGTAAGSTGPNRS